MYYLLTPFKALKDIAFIFSRAYRFCLRICALILTKLIAIVQARPVSSSTIMTPSVFLSMAIGTALMYPRLSARNIEYTRCL